MSGPTSLCRVQPRVGVGARPGAGGGRQTRMIVTLPSISASAPESIHTRLWGV
jgi:hypothetical protein